MVIDADRSILSVGQDKMEDTQLLLLSHKLIIDQIKDGSMMLETEIAELLEKVEDSAVANELAGLDSADITIPV